jgi:hypothetical protein
MHELTESKALQWHEIAELLRALGYIDASSERGLFSLRERLEKAMMVGSIAAIPNGRYRVTLASPKSR